MHNYFIYICIYSPILFILLHFSFDDVYYNSTSYYLMFLQQYQYHSFFITTVSVPLFVLLIVHFTIPTGGFPIVS